MTGAYPPVVAPSPVPWSSMDPVTLIGLVAVALMFTSGVVLLWVGLHRRSTHLPNGAEAVLAAVAEGRIVARPRTTRPVPDREPVVHGAQAVATRTPAPVLPVVAVDEGEERPAVRLVPRTPVPIATPAPAVRPATAAQLVAASRSAPDRRSTPADSSPSAPLPARPAARRDEPVEPDRVAVGVAALEEFFAKEPQLHRF